MGGGQLTGGGSVGVHVIEVKVKVGSPGNTVMFIAGTCCRVSVS